MRIVLVILVIANLLLLGWFQGWMSPLGGMGREPERPAREVMPERLRILPTPGVPAPDLPEPEGAAADPSTDSGGGAITRLPMPPEAPADSALKADLAGPPWARAGCAELGPLTEAQAMAVQAALSGQTLVIAMLQPLAQETWWVYLLPAAQDSAAVFESLRARGLGEGAVLLREGALRGAVVLGRYRDAGNALAVQRRLILSGFPDARLAGRGGPPGTTVLRVQASDESSLRRAAQSGSGPLQLESRPFSEALTDLLERQRDALRTVASPVALSACPQDQAAVFSSRR